MARRLKGIKVPRQTFPSGHGHADFKCYGPPATDDGVFDQTMLCDMGCFKQGGVDTNKYYHGAVVESTISGDWYAYYEFGRTGQGSPSYQFIKGPDKATAIAEYEHQMHAKNDKRGEWINIPGVGKTLQAKAKKDCYLVRPQATRSTGLPDARTIVHGTPKKTVTKSSKKSSLDRQSEKLLSDLRITTASYTRNSMVNDAIPTQEAIDKCRGILNEATKVGNKLITDDKILRSKKISDLTNMVYSLIPKKKERHTDKAGWLLTPTNVSCWQNDIDAFESALQNQTGSETVQNDLPFHLEYIDSKCELGKYIIHWMGKSTKNRHGHVRGLRIKNLWKVVRDTDYTQFLSRTASVAADKPSLKEKPLHQAARTDLKEKEKGLFPSAGTYMLFHGTRTVNVSGIMGTGLRLPKTLSNVSINGAAYGSGIYFADDWKKSAGYCSYRGSYYAGNSKAGKRDAFMFICDVTLGQLHLAGTGRYGTYKNHPKGTHSLAAMGGRSSVANNEFIVFDRNQQNLRYLVEFSEG